MTANPDPEPDVTTGLEPGGGVPPGETPPDSGSVAPQGPRAPERGSQRRWSPWLWIGLIALPALLIAVLVAADGILRVL